MKKIYLLLLFTLSITALGFGQAFNGTYTFGNNGNVNTFAYNGTAIPNLTVGALTKNGVTTSSSNGNFRAQNWNTNTGVNLSKYFQFTLTATGGRTISNPTINFGVGRSNSGPRRFQWRSSIDNYATLMTVTVANGSVSSTGNVIFTPDSNSDFPGNTVALSTTGQSSITFRFYAYEAEQTMGTGGFAGNLTFSGTLVSPPCTPPATQASGYNTTSITTASGTLNWTKSSSNDVLVVMRQDGAVTTDPTNGTNYSASSTFMGGTEIGSGNYVVYKGPAAFVNVTGLTQNTNYGVAVYEFAASGTCFNTTELLGSFSTLCTSVSSLPFTEGFEAGVPPVCWTQFRGTNGLGTIQEWQSSADVHTGTGAAYVPWEPVTLGELAEDWLVTPAIDLTLTANDQLTFYAKDGFTAQQGSIYTVRISTTSQTDRTSFTTVATYNETQLGNSYNLKTVDLTAYDNESTIYIAFVMSQNDGDAFFLDDVSVTGSCSPPNTQASAFNATAIDGANGTATLNWTGGDGGNRLVVVREASAVNADPTSGNTYTPNTVFGSGEQIGTGNYVVYNGSGASVDISNLLVNTTYHVAIYEYNTLGTCYNLTQLTGTFDVSCPTQALPFTENFNGGSVPTCWSVFDNGLGNLEEWTVVTDPVFGSPSANIIFEDGSSGTSQDWLATPPVDLTSVMDAELSFVFRDGVLFDYGSTLSVWVSTTTNNIGQFQMITNEQYAEDTTDNGYKSKTINLAAYAGETIYIAFVMEQDLQDGGDSWYVDDVVVNEVVTTPVGYVYINGWVAPNGDPSGVATEFDNISIVAGTASITLPTQAANLSINTGTILNIPESASLDVEGNLVNDGTLNLQSVSNAYASIIAASVSGTGTFIYNRHVNSGAVGGTGGNDLISAPFSGQSFADFKSANPTSIKTNTDGTLNLFGPFDKSVGMYLTYANDETASLAAGVGYRAAHASSGTFMFDGLMNTGDVDVPISIGGPQFETWNLIGNPYPSYIKLLDFLAANNSKFDASNGGVYGYNGTSGGYEIWNSAYSLLNPDAVITPGQGFLVASNAALVDVNFTSMMRTTGSSDDFIAGRQAADAPIAYLQIKAAIGSKAYTTDLYFTDVASRGLDPNFDSGVFRNGTSNATSLYSRLVQDNAGVDMGIQSLAYTDLNSDISIPLGINAPQGQQVTVSMVNTIVPDGIDVYLEDNLTGVFTLLNTTDYVFTPNSNLNSTGRFFLRFTDNTLSTETSDLDTLQIYALNQTVFINGMLDTATTVTLYDIQGRKVLSSDLESGSINNVMDVSKMRTGIYIVKLNNETQQKTQRVIIK